MGEEGYDIARDMGKVRPSKDKKDATTMPVSDEVKKTQKVNKGPSALELVKKKYGKAVMNVGKKKANEGLDLVKIARAFILEGKVEDEKKKADAKFKKDFAGSLKRNVATQKALPLYKAGGPFIPDKTIDLDTGKKTEPVIKKPYMGKATVPKKAQSDDKKYSPSDDPVVKKADETSRKIKQLRKDVDKSKQGVVDLETDKFFKDVEKRKQNAEIGFDNLRKAVQTGKTKSGEDASKIGTRDVSTLNPDEQRRRGIGGGSTSGGSTEGSGAPEGPKNQSGIVKSKKSKKSFDQFKDEIPVTPVQVVPDDEITSMDGKISKSKTKKQRAPITRGRARKDKGLAAPIPTPKEPSLVSQGPVSKATEFVKKNPVTGGVTGLAAYDLGKGILSKIMKMKSPLTVTGGRVGRRSAGGN